MKFVVRDENPIRLAFLGIVLTLTYLSILVPLGFLEGNRLRSFDTACRWRNAIQSSPPEASQILLIAIDDESQRKLSQKWPLDRGMHAELIKKLAAAGPKVIHLDLVFSGARDPASDQMLAQAIQSGPPVLLASYLDSRGDPVLPYSLLLEAGGFPGLINKPRDADNTVRRFFAAARVPSRPQFLYAIELQSAAFSQGIRPDQFQLESQELSFGDTRVPLELPGAVSINYLAGAKQIPRVSYWEVIEGQVPAEKIRGKIILVGQVASAAEIHHDVYPTSLGTLPGVMISANAILTVLSERFIHPIPIPLTLIGGFFLVLLLLLSAYWLPLGKGIAAAVLITLSALGTSFLGLLLFNLQVDLLSVLILSVSAWMIAALYKHLKLAAEAFRLHRLVVTDPSTGFFNARYFRLRMEADWPSRNWPRLPLTLFAVRTESTTEMLQQATWDQIQKRNGALATALRRSALRRALFGRLGDETLCVLLPGMDLTRAALWAQSVAGVLQSLQGRLGFGLASTQQMANGPWEDLLRCVEAASLRSWKQGERRIEPYDPSKDKVTLGQEQKQARTVQTEDLGYVASELEDRNQALEKALQDLRQAHKEMESHFLEVTKSLVMAMETKDVYTAGHLERVSRYATRLAEALRLPADEIEAIKEAALLHDIGKMHLPDEVLHKTGALTEEERAMIKQHLEMGAKILDPMKFFKRITSLLYHHHERYDGKGYPHGLTGEFIPAGAQVITIADSFDAMTTNRGYNTPLKVQEALEELRKGAGTQFNPAFVEAFVQVVLKEGPQLAGYSAG